MKQQKRYIKNDFKKQQSKKAIVGFIFFLNSYQNYDFLKSYHWEIELKVKDVKQILFLEGELKSLSMERKINHLIRFLKFILKRKKWKGEIRKRQNGSNSMDERQRVKMVGDVAGVETRRPMMWTDSVRV